ncbi:hypothetical protein T190_17525 [Sinorhizobium meliloti CCBAU 01290]|nr:hypothetical protein T190_17525 [Sinorhizobium meliloti CCBAU 01290]
MKEAVLMAESFIATDTRRPAPEPGDVSADLAIGLFDIHLAAESVIVLSLQAMPLRLLSTRFWRMMRARWNGECSRWARRTSNSSRLPGLCFGFIRFEIASTAVWPTGGGGPR